MAFAPLADLPKPVVDDRDILLSGSDLNAIRAGVMLVDGWSYRDMPAIESSGAPDTGQYNLHTAGDYRVWHGGGLYRAGMTTLYVQGRAANYGSTQLQLYVNGALAATWLLASNFTRSYALTGLNDGDPVLVDIFTTGNTSKTTDIVITDVYMEPIVVDGSYPTLTTFAGVYNASRINGMVDAIDWLARRIDAVPMPLSHLTMYAPANYKTGDFVVMTGAVKRYYSNSVLRLVVRQTTNNPSEIVKVYLNDIEHLANSGALSNGTTTTWSPAIDLSIYGAVGDTIWFRIVNHITSANQDAYDEGDPLKRVHSRMTIRQMQVQADPASAYPYASLPTAFPEDASIAASTLDSRLNSLISILNATEARVTGTPEIFNRSRLMRRRFAQDDRQFTKLEHRYVHGTVRRGNRLMVYGKGVKINWGAPEAELAEGDLDYTVSFAHQASLIDGDTEEVKTIYLDEYDGLEVGSLYYLTGDVRYAAEHYITEAS